ncbi:MAG: DUF4007 family protein [Fimbriimonadaceae bacterium]|nr:DUF4007 family protein [Fimbriimonadaceae bacterium]
MLVSPDGSLEAGALSKMTKRIGINFHEGLQLSRERLSSVLRFLRDNPGANRDVIRRGTDLGANMAIAIPNLGVGCGFVEEAGNGRRLTELGERVIVHDPFLEEMDSIWLMHFGLVDPAGRGPTYWGKLMLDFLIVGAPRTSIELANVVSEGESVVRPKIQAAVTKLTDGYTKADLLGNLALMSWNGDAYVGTAPNARPSAAVVAYVLAKRWSDIHPDQLTAGMDTFLSASRFQDIFRLSKLDIEALLEKVKQLGIIDLYTSAPPHQIVRRWHDVSEVMAGLYD